jgi:Tol biopolymer transport system component
MIYTGSLDSAWTRVLVGNATHRDEVLAWSPDSTQIAHTITSGMEGFHGYLRSEPKLRSTEVVIVGLDGLSEDYVFEQPGAWAVCDWSPDGGRLLLLHTLGDETQELTERGTELLEFYLVLARAAAFVSGQRNMGRGNPSVARKSRLFLKKLVPGSGTVRPMGARYSPDGRHVAVEYGDPSQTLWQAVPGSNARKTLGKLGVVDLASGELRSIVDDSEGLRGPICWSPDSKEILFARYLSSDDRREKLGAGHGLAIWAVTADGTRSRFLTTGWSPDWR